MASTENTRPDRVHNSRLMTRVNPARCENCPPERVCAWGCIQGTSMADIVIGAALEQERLQSPGVAEVQQALWSMYNER